MPVPPCLNYGSFLVSSEIGSMSLPTLCCIFQDYFGYSVTLVFPLEFQDQLVNFCREVIWDFDKHRTESIHQLGEYFKLCLFVTSGLFMKRMRSIPRGLNKYVIPSDSSHSHIQATHSIEVSSIPYLFYSFFPSHVKTVVKPTVH